MFANFVSFSIFWYVFAGVFVSGEDSSSDPWKKWSIDETEPVPTPASNIDFQLHIFKVLNDSTKYSSALRPNAGSHPDLIQVNIVITSFGPIWEKSSEYVLDIDLQLSWNDHRLRSDIHKNFAHAILTAKEARTIWVPDLFFPNEKTARFHDITTQNRLVYVSPNGDLFLSMRLTLRLTCPMEFHSFPFDRQTCSIDIESYGYVTTEVQFKWAELLAIQYLGGTPKDVAQFLFQGNSTSNCTKGLKTGTFTCIRAEFFLKRDLFYFFIQNYIPCVLTVFISWIAFYLHIDSTIGRAAVGFITNMTMITQVTSDQSGLPKVGYAKALDIYIGACVMLVFLAIIQFTTVHHFASSEKVKEELAAAKRERMPPEEAAKDLERAQKRKAEKAKKVAALPHCGRFACDLFLNRCLPDCCLNTGSARKTAHQIDVISRFLFPFVFVLFNVIYWPTFMMDF